MPQFSITVDEDTLKVIDDNSKEKGISRSKYVNEALDHFINDTSRDEIDALLFNREQTKNQLVYYEGLIQELTRKIPDRPALDPPARRSIWERLFGK